MFFEDFLHEERPILLRALLGHFQGAFACEWFIGNEQVGAALFLVGVVFARDLPWLGGFGGILVFDQILAISSMQMRGTEGS